MRRFGTASVVLASYKLSPPRKKLVTNVVLELVYRTTTSTTRNGGGAVADVVTPPPPPVRSPTFYHLMIIIIQGHLENYLDGGERGRGEGNNFLRETFCFSFLFQVGVRERERGGGKGVAGQIFLCCYFCERNFPSCAAAVSLLTASHF